MTFLQAINAVQRRLRETETAASNTSTYSKLIGEFVNQAKREVEDAWDWSTLRQDITVTTAAGTSNYTLTSVGTRFRILRDALTNEDAVWNDTQDSRLRRAPYAWIKDQLGTANSTQSEPAYFSISGLATTDAKIDLWPIPDAVYSIKLRACVPQADFLLDSTNDSTVISVPAHVVVLGAYALAVIERGEDMGVNSGEAEMRYRQALGDAIAMDAKHYMEETVWVPE